MQALQWLYYVYSLTCLFKHGIMIVVGTHVLSCLIIQLTAAFQLACRRYITGNTGELILLVFPLFIDKIILDFSCQ